MIASGGDRLLRTIEVEKEREVALDFSVAMGESGRERLGEGQAAENPGNLRPQQGPQGQGRGNGEQKAFDAYPFILLNLVLSTLAAVQAPIIMMSQKRQEAKDRLRSLNDYQVNLKAELEIRHLHEKVDHLISKQWQRLAEIQQLQLEIMQQRRP